MNLFFKYNIKYFILTNLAFHYNNKNKKINNTKYINIFKFIFIF